MAGDVVLVKRVPMGNRAVARKCGNGRVDALVCDLVALQPSLEKGDPRACLSAATGKLSEV